MPRKTAITKCEKAIHLHSIKKKPVLSANKTRSPKTKAYLQRKEFNPFLKHAWLLMGRAQYQKGDFIAAASTFSYITRLYAAEPIVANEARLWMARSYTAMDWYYDAEDALGRALRDTIPSNLRQTLNDTQADLFLSQGKYEEAVPLLQKAAKAERRKLPKARLYFLLGQVHRELGHKREAYKALRKCLKQNPPYELAFNARILQTEVLADAKTARKMVSRLQRMARSNNNKDYLDQVYYAMGNIYMAQNDTARAIGAYEKGRQKATRSGIEKGVLLLRLAGIYWEQADYEKAQKCYAEALGMIDKEYDGYADIARRSKILDELVPYTSAVRLQDSLLWLSTTSEEERNAAIDRVIADLRRQEEEARRAKADSAAAARQQNGQTFQLMDRQQGQPPQMNTQNTGQQQDWYFYNTPLVQQGKQDFLRQWGRRKNEGFPPGRHHRHCRRSRRFPGQRPPRARLLSQADSLHGRGQGRCPRHYSRRPLQCRHHRKRQTGGFPPGRNHPPATLQRLSRLPGARGRFLSTLPALLALGQYGARQPLPQPPGAALSRGTDDGRHHCARLRILRAPRPRHRGFPLSRHLSGLPQPRQGGGERQL